MFNLGVIAATAGLLLWLGFYLNLIQTYPNQLHGSLMFFGFLFSFIIGFLMTAIPKMTQSKPANYFEILIALGLCFAPVFYIYLFSTNISVYIFTLQLIFILTFILSRMWKTKKIPFVGFIFFPFAFTLAFFGIIWTLFNNPSSFKYFYLFCGEAFVLNLICGIGARLIPVICRSPTALNPDQAILDPKYSEYFLYAVLLNSSFFLEFFEYTLLAYSIRIIFLICFSIYKFNLFHKPLQRTNIAFGLQVSILSLILGYLIVLFNPVNYLTGIHVVYISGFSLLTLMVASRVSIAHSQRSINLEINSKTILLTTALIFLSASARYISHNYSPSIIFLFAGLSFLIAIWNWKFFILRP